MCVCVAFHCCLLHCQDETDPDIQMVPELIEQVVLPKLAGIVEFVWDPFCTAQVWHENPTPSIFRYPLSLILPSHADCAHVITSASAISRLPNRDAGAGPGCGTPGYQL